MVALSKSVGRTAMGPAHDVAVVQAALANIKAGMKPYWSRPIDGRKTRELEEAIACFQAANKITPNGKVETFGPTINALRRALPANMRGLRGLPGTTAVCVATAGAQDAGREAREAKARAPFPNKEAAGLATIIATVGTAFGLCLERQREFVTPDGRFAVDLDFTGVRWLDNRSARLLPPGREPRTVINAVCALINKVPEWEVGSPNDLILKSKRQIAALKGAVQASTADLKALGLNQMPRNPVLGAIVAACARMRNSGALATPQGRQDHALLIEAATGADAALARALKGSGGGADSFNGFRLRKIGTLMTGAAGKDFVKRQEGGFRPRLYDLDGAPGLNCTIGYGHLVHRGPCTGTDPAEAPFSGGITQSEAEALLDRDVAVAEGDVKNILDANVLLTQPMFDAFVSLLFNLGRSKADRDWELFEKTRAGDYAGAAPEFLNIDKVTVETKVLDPLSGEVGMVKKKIAVRGLTERRKRESRLYLNGTY